VGRFSGRSTRHAHRGAGSGCGTGSNAGPPTTIAEHQIDAAIGGARRDEEKARAKERVFSFRDEFGQWDPRNQRPELWSLYNGMHIKGEHMRVFPLSNWTELDIWHYIERESLEVPSIYFTHEREVFERDGMLMSVCPYLPQLPHETTFVAPVRYRTCSIRAPAA
jgi:sulfate adenylyltransferase subunit 2